MVEQVDDAVEKVLQPLKELGVEEGTVIIFTSDNVGLASGDNYAEVDTEQDQEAAQK